MSEICISTDVETDGPIAGRHSMPREASACLPPRRARAAMRGACLMGARLFALALALAGLASFAGPAMAADEDDGKPHRPTEAATGPAKLRCGWWDNPTPGNVFFTDRDGDWTFAMQAMYEAEGRFWVDYKPAEGAPRGASHEHVCVCGRMQLDPDSRLARSVTDLHARPLKACRTDPALKGKEPSPR
jgi:Protein of unknown function (DUF4087)